MDTPRRQAEAPSARQQRLERAKRGLIAGYLHALSDRHAPLERVKRERRPAS